MAKMDCSMFLEAKHRVAGITLEDQDGELILKSGNQFKVFPIVTPLSDIVAVANEWAGMLALDILERRGHGQEEES